MPSSIHNIELIVCDNDGCLLPEEPVAITPDRLEPIAAYNRRAEASNGSLPPLIIATGRPCPFVELMLRIVHSVDLPSICEHGAITYSLKENHPRFHPLITSEDLESVIEFRTVLTQRYPDWVLESGKHACAAVYVPEGVPEVDRRLEIIEGIVAEHRWSFTVKRSQTYVNATLPHVNKATALRDVLADLQIEPENVLAIGDTDGDLPLAELCGHFACPANSTPNVKAAAAYVSDGDITAGVVDILRHFIGESAIC